MKPRKEIAWRRRASDSRFQKWLSSKLFAVGQPSRPLEAMWSTDELVARYVAWEKSRRFVVSA